MKNFKINSYSFPIMILLAIMLFFASCGKEEIENPSEDSVLKTESIEVKTHEETKAPLAEVYSQSELKQLKYENYQHSIFRNDFTIRDYKLTFDGALLVADMNVPSGTLTVTNQALNIDGRLTSGDGKFYYHDDAGSVWMDPNDMTSIHVDDQRMDHFEVAKEMLDLLQKEQALQLQHKAALSLLGFGTTDQFLIAREQSKFSNDLKSYDCSWYDNFIAGLIAAPIAVAAAAGCTALTAGCTVGGTLTFGGVAVPCFVLIGGCYGGAFFSVAGAYNYVRENWLCDPITCVFQPPSLVWAGNTVNGRVQLNWSSVQGAQRYQIVQWYNGQWNYMAETSNTSININGLLPGYVYYFGVRTVCNNTATAGVTWTTVFG
ncbi:MAG: fibronectin type III domain-containing protein [Bacteroidota bacterium]